jgi:hypothetical protein
MSCTCQRCGKKYGIDLDVPDDIWDEIRPKGKSKGSGLLCGHCILYELEKRYGYGVIRFVSGRNWE